MKAPAVAVVLGGYVNGYAIVRELAAGRIEPIVLIDANPSCLAAYSRRVDRFVEALPTPAGLLAALEALAADFDQLVLFPTNDEHLEALHAIRDLVPAGTVLPFNPTTLLEGLDKRHQYAVCERVGVPYPRTFNLAARADLALLDGATFPILIKPSTRTDRTTELFRSLLLDDVVQLDRERDRLAKHLDDGQAFLASEVIPGDGSNIYAYAAYRSPRGAILAEWTGKKLSQSPNEFGVFASASNQAPPEVRELGRRLIEALDLYGYAEPEFKYDARDCRYKLMEVNLRSMMWNRVGYLSGVRLHEAQWRDARGEVPRPAVQDQAHDIRLIYMRHELTNLMKRRGYVGTFLKILFGSPRIHFAVFDLRDPRPGFHDTWAIVRSLLSKCRRP